MNSDILLRSTQVLLVVVVFTGGALRVTAQELERRGIHWLEHEQHRYDQPADTNSIRVPAVPLSKRSASLKRMVLGWHPYWASSSAYLSYDYSALTHIAYFSYETDAATGGYTTIRSWLSTPIIEYAHQRGVKVLLTVTNFGSTANTALLSDTNRQNTMIASLISLLQQRGGDGVNFDLESVPAGQRTNLVAFMQRAVARIQSAIPAAEISMAAPAVDWSNAWDLAVLGQACTYLVIMGYNYYWSGSLTAGPVAPLAGENHNVTRSVDTYLQAGVPQQKLVLGVPWYGLDWPVISDARMSATTGTSTSRTYIATRTMSGLPNRIFDVATQVPYFSYQSSGNWRQVWYDDSTSLAAKYALVNTRDIAGIGIWALSYDGGRQEIWSGIRGAFGNSTDIATATYMPADFMLEQNYPNPFNATTILQITNHKPQILRLTVFDLLGREMEVLMDEEKPPGTYRVTWDASRYSSGLYFCRLTANGRSVTRSAVLTK